MSRVPYASALGILMYAMVYTRPNIAHALGFLSRYMSKLGKENWTAVKRVFRYLRGTIDYAICYQGSPGLDRVINVHGFVDADWDGDLDHRISTSGYVFNLFGGSISWIERDKLYFHSQLQKLNTWQPLMQAKKLCGCKYCVQVLGLYRKV